GRAEAAGEAAAGREAGAGSAAEAAALAAAAAVLAAAALRGGGDAMDLVRLVRPFFTHPQSVARPLSPEAMKAIEKAIGEEEKRHGGQLRVAVEAALPLSDLVHGVESRERAIGWFARLRMWDTEHNAGVLIYLLLADRRVELVADRGIHS